MIRRNQCLVSFSIFLYTALYNFAFAQHCSFDGVYLLGVRPFENDSSELIDNLKITIVDENGYSVDDNNEVLCKQNSAHLVSFFGKPISLKDVQYAFAKDDYVYVGRDYSLYKSKLFVRIEDLSERKQKWQTKMFPIQPSHFVHLCSYSELFYSKQTKDYHPIWVKLVREKNASLPFNAKIGEDSIGMSISNDVKDFIATRRVERDGWIFEKNWFWSEAISDYVNDSKKVRNKSKKQVYTSYKITELKTNKIHLLVSGETYQSMNNVKFELPDIRDVNFDGKPDLKVSVFPPDIIHFYGYEEEVGSFVKLSISNLSNVKIDFLNQKVFGVEYEYGSPKTNPIAIVEYELSGKNWSDVKSSRTVLAQPDLSKKDEKVKIPLFSKKEGEYIYELWDIEPKDQVILDANSGAYAKKVVVKEVRTDQLVYMHFIKGNDYLEAEVGRCFFVVKDFNMDGVADIYIPRMHPTQKDYFLYSDKTNDALHFISTVDYKYSQWRFLGRDISQCEDELLSEYQDFNGDGYKDLRIQNYCDDIGDNCSWSYYLFDKDKNSLEYSLEYSSLDYLCVGQTEHVGWTKQKLVNGELEVTFYKRIDGRMSPWRKSIWIDPAVKYPMTLHVLEYLNNGWYTIFSHGN